MENHMGSQVKIKTVLDTKEAPEPVYKRKEYYSELECLLIFPVDTIDNSVTYMT